MSRSSVINSKPLRTYERKPQAQHKQNPTNGKTGRTLKAELMPTFSQILNQNNSMLLEIDLDRIEESNSKKRKSTESALKTSLSNIFAVPQPVKKSKIEQNDHHYCSIVMEPEAPDELFGSEYSQNFLQNIEQESCVLTQVNSCIDLKGDENFISIITNPVTCSQYVQLKHDDESGSSNQFIEEQNDELKTVTEVDELPKTNFDYDSDGCNEFNEELIRKTIEAEADLQKKGANNDVDKLTVMKIKPGSSKELIGKLDIVNSNTRSSEDVKLKDQSKLSKPEASSNRIEERNYSRQKVLPVSSSSFRELGPFFGLTRRHQHFIMKTKRIEGLYDWQEECLGLRAIHDKTNLIYALPTSGGKTLVAEIAMFREVLLRKKNVIFVVPYVSIVQEKVQDLLPFAAEFNFIVEEYCAGKGSIPPARRRKKNTIYICTIEKSQILFDSLSSTGRLKEAGMIVIDELHMVGDGNRGYSLETLLMKAVFQKEVRIQVIGMSATIANLHEIARFLNADIYTRDFRPVELKEYVKIGSDILSIDGKKKFVSEAFTYERTVGDRYKSGMLKRDPDHIAGLVLEVVPESSCLIFCATKQNCESVALLLTELLPKELRDDRKDEKINLIEGIKADSNGRICSILAKTLPFGVAYHHSGLTSDERKHLEEAYRLNILSVICCTSTLAAGVNLPAKRVIIRSPYVGNQFLTLTRYKQMVGRAGRAGKCETGESIMIVDPKDHDKLTNLLCSSMDETISGFLQDESGKMMRTVLLNLLSMQLVTSIDDLVEFFKCSLLSGQLYRVYKTLRQVIVRSTNELMVQGALTYTTNTTGTRYASFKFNDQEVFPDDILEVSKLGKAAVNAGLSLEDAQKLEEDLVKANENLVLTQCLHLLFIVAPEDIIESVNPDHKYFNNIVMRLKSSMMHTANVVGVTESLAMKIITRPGAIKESDKRLVKRFYVALMLFDLWNGKNVHEVATQYKVNRGIVFNLMTSAASRSYCIFRFCEIYEEFWVFKEILEKFSKRLTYCCSAELLPLMELPNVKIGRAKLLFAAGLRTVEEIAVLSATDLIQTVNNVNLKQAQNIIRAAKYLMIEKIEECQERLEDMKEVVKPSKTKSK